MMRAHASAGLLVLSLSVGCTTAPERVADQRPEPSPPPAPVEEPSMTSKTPPPVSIPPPPLPVAPAEDTARYVEWMAGQNRPVKDMPTEAVALRIGDWGFFAHGGGPGQSLDRTALDRASHWVQRGDRGHWYAFLTTPGLDAAGAMERVAWLYSGIAVTPEVRVQDRDKVTAPTLTIDGDTAVLQGFVTFPPNVSVPVRMTITATKDGAKIVNEPASSL
jgi:hypothetical protein